MIDWLSLKSVKLTVIQKISLNLQATVKTIQFGYPFLKKPGPNYTEPTKDVMLVGLFMCVTLYWVSTLGNVQIKIILSRSGGKCYRKQINSIA